MAEALYERFDTRAGFDAAVDQLLAQDGRELRAFDPDGQSLRLNDPARVAALEKFLLASRTRRFFLVLHEVDWFTRHCPRGMQLLQRFSHAIQIHRTHEEIREVQDAFLVLDAAHYVRRPAATSMRGAMGLNDDTEALAMRGRFQEIWAASYPAVSASTAGL